MENTIPRGISIPILLDQVRNTAPFIGTHDGYAELPYVKRLLEAALDLEETRSHSEYFGMCLAAHWTTVATNVPTDVDNQIRFRLWHPQLPLEETLAMAQTVLQARAWPIQKVSGRWVLRNGKTLSGHNGEWFSTAVAAYRATEKKHPETAKLVYESIVTELDHHQASWSAAYEDKQGIETLKISTIIAHNLGDFKRVLDMWNTPDDHDLYELFKKISELEEIQLATQLNGSYMASENHRHFALRKPKSLRRYPELMVPIGPFFDNWGKRIASHPDLSPTDLGEIMQALIDGWIYLEGSLSYARALCGMESVMGLSKMTACLPVKVANFLKSGKLRSQCSLPQQRFELGYETLPFRTFSTSFSSSPRYSIVPDNFE